MRSDQSRMSVPVVMTLLCRDEADVLPDWLAFHLSNGVDQFVVTDNGSGDNSLEILAPFVRSGHVTLLREPGHVHDQARWVSRMAQIAVDELGADWVIHSDADEFWWCGESSIPDVLAGCPDSDRALAVRRSNFLPPGDDSLDAAVPFWSRQLRRATRSVNYLGAALPPKVCHRRGPEIWVEDGNHGVRMSGRRIPARETTELEILHFPERSYEQFERKIRQGARALAANSRISGGVGATWTFVYDNYLRAGEPALKDYYRSLSAGRSDGWVLDTRLRDHMLDLQARMGSVE